MNNLSNNYKDYYSNKNCYMKQTHKNICNTTLGNLDIIKGRCPGNLSVDNTATFKTDVDVLEELRCPKIISNDTINANIIYTNTVDSSNSDITYLTNNTINSSTGTISTLTTSTGTISTLTTNSMTCSLTGTIGNITTDDITISNSISSNVGTINDLSTNNLSIGESIDISGDIYIEGKIYRNNKISIYPFSNATWIWNITDVDTSNSIINTEMSYQGGYWYLTTTNTNQTQVDYEYLFDDIREDTNYTVTFTLFDTNSRLFDISKNNTGFNYSIQDNSTNNFSHMITVFGN